LAMAIVFSDTSQPPPLSYSFRFANSIFEKAVVAILQVRLSQS
jgi:hypothetical protein